MIANLELGEQVLAAQSFSRLIGARITEFRPGKAVLEVPITDDLRQQFGLVHGGVFAYLVDNVATFAAGSVLGPSLLTTGMSLTYLRSAREGLLRATATVDAHDGTNATAKVQIDVISDDGTVTRCAAGEGTATITRRAAK